MGCKFSRHSDDESECGESTTTTKKAVGRGSTPPSSQHESRTHLLSAAAAPLADPEDGPSDQRAKKPKTKAKKKTSADPPHPKLSEEKAEGLSNGGVELGGGVNGELLDSPSLPSLSTDKLHRNFQERLITSQISRNGQKLTDSQQEFFKMLDDKINKGRDMEIEML